MDLRNKKVAVVGLGTSGVDACFLLDSVGAIVSATDNEDNDTIQRNIRRLESKYIETEIGGHTEKFLEDAELLVVSPGVNRDALPIKFALENCIPIIGELELGFQLCKAGLIAITGTNGKSTVVTLLTDILRRGGKDARACGNIGNSLSGEAMRADSNNICILEVSSFQLEWIVDFRPAISCILNITEDHLDRYHNFDDYLATKLKISSNQKEGDLAILNYDDDNLRKTGGPHRFKQLFYSRHAMVKGIYFEKAGIICDIGGRSKRIFSIPPMNLRGSHNLENCLAACLIALIQGVESEIIESALREFKPLDHRMESLGEINGVEFLDDSKGTNIDATRRALGSIDKRIILIAGGRDKGADYNVIRDLIQSKVKKMILIGEASPIIERAFKNKVEIKKASSLEEATFDAFGAADRGEAVLLSPMCSSFDMFRDYKHRGKVFRAAVETLKVSAEAGKSLR